MPVPGVLRIRTLRQAGIDLELRQHRAGVDDVARAAGQLEHRARAGRRHLDHRLGGFHGHQRLIELDDIADLDEPLDDGGVGQAFAEVGEVEGFVRTHCGLQRARRVVGWKSGGAVSPARRLRGCFSPLSHKGRGAHLCRALRLRRPLSGFLPSPLVGEGSGERGGTLAASFLPLSPTPLPQGERGSAVANVELAVLASNRLLAEQ